MQDQPFTLDIDSRELVVRHLTTRFSKELSLIYPCTNIGALVGELSDDDLASLITGEMPFIKITERLALPEIKSLYWQIIQNYPDISHMYPNTNIFELPPNQLEMLARGERICDVLGKPTHELDVLTRQGLNLMDPPTRKKVNYSRSASPRQAFLGGGKRINVKESSGSDYRGRSRK